MLNVILAMTSDTQYASGKTIQIQIHHFTCISFQPQNINTSLGIFLFKPYSKSKHIQIIIPTSKFSSTLKKRTLISTNMSTTNSTTVHSGPAAGTTHSHGSSNPVKSAFAKVHGVGEAVRGEVNGAVDSAFNEVRTLQLYAL